MPTATRTAASRSPRRSTSHLTRASSDLATYRAELLRILHEAYAGPAWHGSSLRGALRGVDADEAMWRGPGLRNRIWDLVAHAAYTRHLVRRRLEPETTDAFPMVVERSWWPRVELNGLSADAAWRRDRALLADQHAKFIAFVESLPAKRLIERRPGKKHVWGVEISGVALHDTYHGGQIGLIRRLFRNR
jgi:DinB family protein